MAEHDIRREQVAAPQGAATETMARVASPLLQRKIQRRLVQRRAESAAADGRSVQAAASEGISGSGGALPHLDTVQRSFGRHDVASVTAHTDARAASASQAMGAEAFATGDHVAFNTASPSLHTVAHEAAHVVQQRGGVSLKGGVGEEGDAYERHADAVADAVVAGRSAEDLLDQHAGGSPGVQRKAVQLRGNKAVEQYGKTKLEGFTEDHIFKGEVKDREPKGLHAYTDSTAGEGVDVLKTLGNTNRVHVIIWTKGTAKAERNAKWSSMFPKDMHKGIAAWYINNGPGAVDGEGNDRGKIGTGWATINVQHTGDTAYPLGGPDWKSACSYDNVRRAWFYDDGGTKYKITNP